MDAGAGQQIIDILMVIDADTIVAGYPPGTAAQPTSIDKPLIWLVVNQGNAVFGEGSKELKIKARTLDEVRWREATLSLNSASVGVLYKFFALRGDDLLSPPTPLLASVKTRLPNPADPTHPGSQVVQSYFWSTTVLQPGEVTYAFQFMIVDRDGAVQGYYAWDPFLAITS